MESGVIEKALALIGNQTEKRVCELQSGRGCEYTNVRLCTVFLGGGDSALKYVSPLYP